MNWSINLRHYFMHTQHIQTSRSYEKANKNPANLTHNLRKNIYPNETHTQKNDIRENKTNIQCVMVFYNCQLAKS